MRAICGMWMALLVLLALEGSATTLESGFGEGDEGWISEGGGHVRWQRFGGDPGGFLEGEGDDIRSYRSPPSWAGDWSRYIGGVFSYDLRLIASGGSEPPGVEVKILSSDGTVLSSSPPPSERFWTREEVVLNASNFGVSEADLRRVMRSVAGITVGPLGFEARTTLGLDDVVVAPPLGAGPGHALRRRRRGVEARGGRLHRLG